MAKYTNFLIFLLKAIVIPVFANHFIYQYKSNTLGLAIENFHHDSILVLHSCHSIVATITT